MHATIERADALDTQVVNANDLRDGDYVLLPEDVEEADVPLLVDEDYDRPALWRVDDWYSDGPEGERLYFDGPGNVSLDLQILPDDQVRRVVPGQQHETW